MMKVVVRGCLAVGLLARRMKGASAASKTAADAREEVSIVVLTEPVSSDVTSSCAAFEIVSPSGAGCSSDQPASQLSR